MTIDALDMSGKAGLVTGAAGSTGLAVSRGLVEYGGWMVMVDRHPTVGSRASEVGASGLVADLSRPEAAEAMVNETAHEFGRMDFIANVAGAQSRGSMVETTDEQWDILYTVNLRAVFAACRAAAGRMLHDGTILNITSTSGTVG